ncbi:MAG: hypothetical protein R3F62_26170 [Planctomycetota bacterium]
MSTTAQSGSRTMASNTSAASPVRRPPKAVWLMARTSASTEPQWATSSGWSGVSPSWNPSW